MPSDPDAPSRRLPAAILPGAAPVPASAPPPDAAPPTNQGSFELLVKDESDRAGLMAFGLLELARRDWDKAFRAERGHAPNERDIAAFDVGQRMPRRIEHYRRLGEAMLEAPKTSAPAAAPSAMAPTPSVKGLIIRLAMLGVAVVVVGLLIRIFIVQG
jgi:hypothetical protein